MALFDEGEGRIREHGNPPEEWPAVHRRVLENQEPLRQVAGSYGVSYETVRRIVIASRKKDVE